ncbi:hypothetical protein CANMA_004149 [Candida margitis]|uniref:uncharacterized protein n=1 Tax=Candida margitis TaxID=1775924 RepID=UPI0022270F85|nr:uncharacterized protein CANMA_004149 [Candida margitis]KAI5959025.1 hypothetical protein CANMA_004149 [Candida margitis]
MALLDIQQRPSQPVQLKSPHAKSNSSSSPPSSTTNTTTTTTTVLPKFEETVKAAHGDANTHSGPKQQQQPSSVSYATATATDSNPSSLNYKPGESHNHAGFNVKVFNVNESVTTPASALSTPPAVKAKGDYESNSNNATSNFQSPGYKTGEIISHPLPTPPSKLKSQDSPSLPTLPSTEGSIEQAHGSTDGSASAANHPNVKPTSHINTDGTSTSKTNLSSPVCRNCKTQTTPLWRRDETGQVLCNACGLFLKLHGRPRPISLKTDTIKSRNRVKSGANGANSSSKGATASNTPELKSKDSKSGKKSPKSKKLKNATGGANGIGGSNTHGNDLTPLLPATSGSNTPATFKPEGGNSVGGSHSYNNLASINGNGYYQQQQQQQHSLHHTPHFPPHLPNHVLQAHQQVPLHYPSSTPTQFAPGLRRITSPLMLSTTSSSAVRNEPIAAPAETNTTAASSTAESNSMHAAAGVLENLSNELGPSATFKPDLNTGARQKGVSLMQKDSRPTNSNTTTTTGSSSSIFSSVTPPQLPRLPALNKTSPAFSAAQSRSSTPTLPPLHHVASGEITLPSLNKFSLQQPHQTQHPASTVPTQQQSTNNSSRSGSEQPSNSSSRNETPKGNDNHSSNDNNRGGSSNNNNNNNSNPHEVTILKTRISELELVNDLYRTRIMELEAMEHAARLRETSMRKRLEEAVELQASQLEEYNRKQEMNASKFGVGSGQRLYYHQPSDPEIAAAVSNSRQVIGYQSYLAHDEQMAQAQHSGIQLSERLGQSQKQQHQQQQQKQSQFPDGSVADASRKEKPTGISTHEGGSKRTNDSSVIQGNEKKSKLN